MRAYELMVIVDAEVDDPGVQAVIDQVKEQIALRSGDVKKVDLWGRRRFAYEIDHKHEGTYVVLEFVAPGTGLDDLERWHRLAAGHPRTVGPAARLPRLPASPSPPVPGGTRSGGADSDRRKERGNT